MASFASVPTEPCVPIPMSAEHGVSMSLPEWNQAIRWCEGDMTLRSKAVSAYPRFFIHKRITELVEYLVREYGRDGETAIVLSTNNAARRCRDYIREREPDIPLRILQLSTPNTGDQSLGAKISAVFLPEDKFLVAKQYWQHTGEGVSSRHAQYFLESIDPSTSREHTPDSPSKPTESTARGSSDEQVPKAFVEERFGRNMRLSQADDAKAALRKRICALVQSRGRTPLETSHVYLYPTGMTAVFSAHRLVLEVFDSAKLGLKSVCFGFPYADTLKILEKWGPGAVFYPNGDEKDLDTLEAGLKDGSIKISSLFCEIPTNPLLNSPNLIRIRKLADKYNFAVVIDDTVGNIYNVDALSYADVTVASLTKLFSGDCNVMSGGLLLNPKSKYFERFESVLHTQYEDAFWPEDAIYLERNSRDFGPRNKVVNENTEALCELIRGPKYERIIKHLYYPKYSASRGNYDAVRFPDGGYGCLFSILFSDPKEAVAFYDNLAIAKGPSLGTNFTLGSPYTILAHFAELDFVESCGVDRNLVRISVGLEDRKELLDRFRVALDKALEI